jgi:O-succinylbenzoate synthase
MLIEKINIHHLRMALQSPFETSFGSSATRDSVLLEVYSEGLVGYGECVADYDPGYNYETAGTAMHIYHEFIIPATLWKEVQDAQDFQNKVKHVRGHQMAKAGMEMALWDLMGKREGRSLRELLGGVRKKVEVGVSVGIQKSPEALLETVEGYLQKGYRRVKIKIKPGRDVVETQAVRIVYPDLRIMVDANSAYTLENASALKPLDELNLLMIEQPLSGDDMWDHHRLQEQFITPICLDESIVTPRHARQALEMKACRVINIKPGRVGGLSQAVAIHDLCFAQEVPVWCGGMLETGVGRASNLAIASLEGFVLPGDISASERYYKQDITDQVFTLNPDSTISVPDTPGLGVTIIQDEVKRVSEQTVSYS